MAASDPPACDSANGNDRRSTSARPIVAVRSRHHSPRVQHDSPPSHCRPPMDPSGHKRRSKSVHQQQHRRRRSSRHNNSSPALVSSTGPMSSQHDYHHPPPPSSTSRRRKSCAKSNRRRGKNSPTRVTMGHVIVSTNNATSKTDRQQQRQQEVFFDSDMAIASSVTTNELAANEVETIKANPPTKFCQPCSSSPDRNNGKSVDRKKRSSSKSHVKSKSDPPCNSDISKNSKNVNVARQNQPIRLRRSRSRPNSKELSRPNMPSVAERPPASNRPRSKPDISNSLNENQATRARRSRSRPTSNRKDCHMCPPNMPRRMSDPCCNSEISNSRNENSNQGTRSRRSKSAVFSRWPSQTLSTPNMPRVTEDEEYPSTAATTSRKANYANHYQIGQTLAKKRHSVPFTSPIQATTLLTELPLNSPLFVKRTSREWTYAILAEKVTNDLGKLSLVVYLKNNGKNKKILERSKWERCLRLVKQNKKPVSSSVIPPPKGMEVLPQSRRNTRPEHQMPELSNLTSSSILLPDTVSSNLTPSRKSQTTRKSVSFGGNTNNNRTGRLGRKLAKKNKNAIGNKDGAATISSATIYSASTKSVSFCCTTNSIPSSKATSKDGHYKSHSFHYGARRTGSKSPHAEKKNTSSKNDDDASTKAFIQSLQRLRSKSMPPPSSTCTPSTVSPRSDSSPTAVAVNLTAQSFRGSRRDRMRPRHRGGSSHGDVVPTTTSNNSNGSVSSRMTSAKSKSFYADKHLQRVRCKSTPPPSSSTTSSTISPGSDSPPIAVAVNLTAQSFRGSRRDRMRPRQRGSTSMHHHGGEQQRSANNSFLEALGSLNKLENTGKNTNCSGSSIGSGSRASLSEFMTQRSSTLVGSVLR